MIQEILLAHMETNETLLETFGRRIYPVFLPDSAQFPAIVYEVRMPLDHAMGQPGSISEAEFNLTVYAGSYRDAWLAAAVLRSQLDGQSGMWGDTRIGACLLGDMGDAPALVAENEAAIAWGVRLPFTIQFEE